ncbi:FGGY-family carbohydrate kinase [Tropicimonas isoalkanivorans]|uniref:FGGY-family pentulose kinase n=1 Tax=Tropicimonas isoalkanivorans TaxID=441112 RepID=A0A1I1PTW9_9RHOB|nr:FGGY-family carbohydrate kinase [Tropicimonas isoalkanivorans]SFD13316.1 FGGY-family pentulose kinase [Tropicimonas isoalkanivorans]
MKHYLGVDVGTGSARAGLFDANGTLKGSGVCAIETLRPAPDFAQQRSAEIWTSVCAATREALAEAGVTPGSVAGVGFDATCSLVVSGENDAPVTVSPEGEEDQDVILWMDHRAMGDAEEINAIGGEPLEYVGGRISPEMELPKLRWLKRELPESWSVARRFWDLPDWLVHRATGEETRSLCSTVCKWTYLGHKGLHGEGWDDGFLETIGLGDLAEAGHAAIGQSLAEPGAPCGTLTEQAASEMGLLPGTSVAASLIDAHAGAVGTLGVALGNGDITTRLAIIAGTSTCHIGLTEEPVFVPGVWGPYFGVVLKEYWALEGGQSAAGALIDAVIARHAAAAPLEAEAKGQGKRITDLLDARLTTLAEETATLTADRHVQPDFHGNRSPLAEPWRRGAISGLSLESGPDDLALDYLATVQALAYGTRHIIDEMRNAGARFDTLVMSGGLAKNTLFLRETADATGCTIVVPDQREPVLLGSAMLGSVAAGDFESVRSAMTAMCGQGATVAPRGGDIAAYHDRKYRVFRRMQDDYAAYRTLMAREETDR